jgi:hypothetical protein
LEGERHLVRVRVRKVVRVGLGWLRVRVRVVRVVRVGLGG